MNNNKGYTTLTILVVILLITSMLLLLFYKPIFETSKNVAKSNAISDKITKDANGKERLYSLLKNNISFEDEISYEDLDKKYIVKTVDQDFEIKELHFSPHNLNNFSLKNSTDIHIKLSVKPIDKNEKFSYNVELMINGKDLLEGTGQNLKADADIKIPASKVYNKETGETHYGEYLLNIPNAVNCSVNAIVVYDKLYYREISINSDGFNKNVIIENDNKDNNITIKLKQGGD